MLSGGGYTGVVPPDPISTSAVKYSWADDSGFRESRTPPPESILNNRFGGFLFFFLSYNHDYEKSNA